MVRQTVLKLINGYIDVEQLPQWKSLSNFLRCSGGIVGAALLAKLV